VIFRESTPAAQRSAQTNLQLTSPLTFERKARVSDSEAANRLKEQERAAAQEQRKEQQALQQDPLQVLS